MTEIPAAQPNNADRNLAMLNYGLLAASVFLAGVPALIAVVIAYAQRDQAARELKSHFDFQVRLFWIAFALTVVAVACAAAAVVLGIGELLEFAANGGFDAWEGFHADVSEITVGAGLVVSVVGAVLFSILAALWLLGASAFGFIRLASARRIGQQAP